MGEVRRRARAAGASLIVIAAATLALAAPVLAAPPQPGAQRLTYKVGPLTITPGQNRIAYTAIEEKPQVDGYITRIKTDLV